MIIMFPSAPDISIILWIYLWTIKPAKPLKELSDHANCPTLALPLPSVLPLPSIPQAAPEHFFDL